MAANGARSAIPVVSLLRELQIFRRVLTDMIHEISRSGCEPPSKSSTGATS
jgi:hypothetical protein